MIAPLHEVVLAKFDDWQALYVDGKCVAQGHEVRTHEVVDEIQNLAGESFSYDEREVDYDWMADRSDLPKSLAEVVFV